MKSGTSIYGDIRALPENNSEYAHLETFPRDALHEAFRLRRTKYHCSLACMYVEKKKLNFLPRKEEDESASADNR
jgi:hypothetical protein